MQLPIFMNYPMINFTKIASFSFLLLFLANSESHSIAQDENGFFQFKIAPILEAKCVSCHNDNDLAGELSLQSKTGLIAGGESGEVIDGKDPDSSSLIDYIVGDEPEMPKDADPLSKAEIDLLKKWVEMGAKWPDQLVLKNAGIADLNWWSLKPIQAVDLAKWVGEKDKKLSNPIDAFVSEKHDEQKMKFAVEADRRTLIRRLYFDLIGLPPTPTEISEFVNSTDPNAYEKLVDRLLASPHYGERWARHWLDVVQYGETHGYDKDKLRPNSWPYRDYVIRAFNEDRPYSKFIREQLAGDVLWPNSTDGIVATGFIAAGPWDFIGHAEVPESKTDGMVARNLDRDNMVTSTMNTFCSLTVQCARCHDHKLDPVTMDEYYSLQAVFASIDRADRSFDASPEIATKRFELLNQRKSLTEQLAKLNLEFEAMKTDGIKKLEAEISDLTMKVAGGTFPATSLPRSGRFGYHSHVASTPKTVKWVQVDLGHSVSIDQVILMGADEYGFKDFGFPHQFVIECSDDPEFDQSQIISDFRDRDFPRPGASPSIFQSDHVARFVRVTATKLWSRRQNGQPKSNDWIFAMGEMSIISDGRLVKVQNVSSLDSIEAMPRWGKANLVDHVFGNHDLETKLGIKESPTNGFHSQFSNHADTTKWVTIDLGEPKSFDQIEILPAYPTDFADTPGFGFPIRFKIEASNAKDFATSDLVFNATKSDFANPLTTPLVVSLNDKEKFQFIRLTATKLWDRGDSKFLFALGEMNIISNGEIISKSASVSSSDSINGGRWHEKFLVDGFTSRLSVTKIANYFQRFSPSADAKTAITEKQTQLQKLMGAAVGAKLQNEIKQTSASIASLDSQMSKLPKPQRVYAGTVHKGSGNFVGRAGLGPREIRVLHRGEVTQPGKTVPPGTVPFISAAAATFEFGDQDSDGRRRLALANWITRKDNTLTWRSIVNRVWQYHFGVGIVDTPNDFGRGGSKPTHPELLDWLAVEFRDGGKHLNKQSIKSLHRLILNSRTYKQTSQSDDFSEADQGNRFLWKMNRRRLDAEQIHDSVLTVTKLLNLKMGGPSYKDFVIERPEHSPHYEYHLYDPMDTTTHRRAIYRFIVRSQPQPFMDTLNCADPSSSVPKRSETLTALQALGMLNNRFMVAMSKQFATRLRKEADDHESQVAEGFRLLTGRKPIDEEARLLSEYADQHGLENLCRVLFNLNEFIFVD